MSVEHTSEVINLVGAVIGLLLISVGALAVSERLRLPFTILLVLTGVGLAQLGTHGPAFFQAFADFQISPDVILFVFLPTLIFESAFNLDPRQLRRNLAPILALAVPGLLISTFLIAAITTALTPIDFTGALVLGAILSATDPVAVIALFKQLGAPKRLNILVEGESLFNDATAIVAAKILLGVAAATYAGSEAFSGSTLIQGTIQFLVVFFGGVLVGWLLALATGYALGRVHGNPEIEISLTTILAYFSFLIGEHVLHVSGVMATVAAAITMGAWGRTKISPSVKDYLEHFWEYMAYVANALIFLLVGLQVNLDSLAGSLDLIAWVVLAMIVARAVVVYGLVPLVGRMPNSEPIGLDYQSVMFWGGLRGAIALAIVLSLGEFRYADLFVNLVTGAVLFTLLVPGLTIEKLVRYLGLDRAPLSERLARTESAIAAKRRALEHIPELQRGGLFSSVIANQLRSKCEQAIQDADHQLHDLRREEMDTQQEYNLFFLRCLGVEKTYCYNMFTQGHLSERAYRNLAYSIELQIEGLRHAGHLPSSTLYPSSGHRLHHWRDVLLEKVLRLTDLAERLRASQTARDYEQAWGRHQASGHLLQNLEQVAVDNPSRTDLRESVRQRYTAWNQAALERIDEITEQFPEFVAAMQTRLAERMVLQSEREAIDEQHRSGTLSGAVAHEILHELERDIHGLRGHDTAKLRLDPEELLRKVPFFHDIESEDFAHIAARLRQRTVPAGEAFITQGEPGDSLFLIARGVVRVSRSDGKLTLNLATLMAGDFVGEAALLHQEPRSATCRAVTPCALYELRHQDFDELRKTHPSIQTALEQVDQQRHS